MSDSMEVRRLGGKDILEEEDVPVLKAGRGRVHTLMSDKLWHTRKEIELAAGENGLPAAEGMRRMRDLRQWFSVVRKRISGTRQWQYKMKSR